ncbi:MAG TPA: decarboxylating 6-phosphogluconate dehydrogenase [Sphingomicrobium sp.]|nr:decarboxylating 6-phosphogluconate dehydrogenase [Sphingomicrobium sp.]
MRLAVIGLGRMGANISRRLMRGGHEIVAFDRDEESVQKLVKEGVLGAGSLSEAVAMLDAPRIFWVMLPAGGPTEDTVAELRSIASPGDVVIDGGNSFFKDDIRRHGECAASGVHYVDVGTSGGVWGLERGYCLMIGGDKQVVDMLDPIFDTLAPGYGTITRTPGREGGDDRAERGYIHAGPAGAGHFVKMVHNGIEYGLMQAYAEGFDVLKGRASEKLPEGQRFELNLPDVAEVWRRGSVISSWLLDLCALELAEDHDLEHFSGRVADSGEGQWTVDAAMEEAIPANVLTAALFARYRSRTEDSFADKLLSAMRFGFGGHVEMPQ